MFKSIFRSVIFAVFLLVNTTPAQGLPSANNYKETLLTSEGTSFQNPILPGFHPDPSICRVGEDYYLITSTFEYFPGVPVFHSTDLVHWNQIGHILNRPSQLNLDGMRPSGGIYAPTLRYNNGKYYMITTLVGNGGNFIVTANNPEGPWSDPVWLKTTKGIDPSIFFDSDGKAYVCGNTVPDNGEAFPKQRFIWMQEMDPNTLELTGEKKIILDHSALYQASSVEGPHVFKRKGYYYLVIAEGGTGWNHSVVIGRSKTVFGPYELSKINPIMTHRHLGENYPIACTGHADFIETQTGKWYMVLLATRPTEGGFYNIGRETFLAPVIWEKDWPVVSPGTGKIEFEYPMPGLPRSPIAKKPVRDEFTTDSLDFVWNFLRTPRGKFYSLTDNPGKLRLFLRAEKISDWVHPTFVGRRQQHLNFNATAKMDFKPGTSSESAGLVVIQNANYHFRLELMQNAGKNVLRLTERRDSIDKILNEMPVEGKTIQLRVSAQEQDYNFYCSSDGKVWTPVMLKADGKILSKAIAGGFTGAYVGMYASSNGKPSQNYADFDWFEYIGEENKK